MERTDVKKLNCLSQTIRCKPIQNADYSTAYQFLYLPLL